MKFKNCSNFLEVTTVLYIIRCIGLKSAQFFSMGNHQGTCEAIRNNQTGTVVSTNIFQLCTTMFYLVAISNNTIYPNKHTKISENYTLHVILIQHR